MALILTDYDKRIGTITFNRAEKRNSVSAEMLKELIAPWTRSSARKPGRSSPGLKNEKDRLGDPRLRPSRRRGVQVPARRPTSAFGLIPYFFPRG